MKKVLWWATRALLWVVTALLALWMMDAGLGKFQHHDGWVLWFGRWGYPAWFVTVIGVVELVGGALLLVPALASYAAAILCAVMIGALVTVTTNTTDLSWIDPLVGVVMLTMMGLVRWNVRWRPALRRAEPEK